MGMARAIFISWFFLGLVICVREANSQEPDPWQEYPAREVERPALPVEGGFEIDLAIESLSADQVFDDNGNIKNADDTYNLFSLEFLVRYGINERWEVFLGVPYLTGEIGETSGGAIGDIYIGSRVGLHMTPVLDFSVGLAASMPTGNSDYRFEVVGPDLIQENFRTGNPGVDYYPQLEARYNTGDWSWRFEAAGVITEKGEVTLSKTAVAHDEVDVDPGDGYRLHAGVYYQFSDSLVPGLFFDYSSVAETDIDGQGQDDEMVLFEIRPQIMYQLSPEVDAILSMGYAAFGKNAPAGYPFSIEIKSRF